MVTSVPPATSIPGSVLSVSGLATGLDTTSIINGLLSVQQAQVQLLTDKQTQVQQVQTAFKDVEAKLLALQGAVSNLSSSQNGAFSNLLATSSNESLITAAASSSATPGQYTLRVNQLAAANEIASQGFDSSNATITQGTVQIGAGSASTTITIDGTNNTLNGLAQAINNANVGVRANVVSDGRSQPFRLLLTSTQTGTANAITVTNNLAADNGTARRPEFAGTYVGNVSKGASFTGTSNPTSNAGAGAYTGTANNSYQFTVVTGGTVGTDGGIQISYKDSTGAHTGTLSLNPGDAGSLKAVAEGIQVQFSAGTLVAGQTFSIDASVPTVQQAADASVALGSGSGALTVNQSTNTINDLFPGVTLNLNGADPNTNVTLNVAPDVKKATTAIQDFVTAYNGVIDDLNSQQSFDSQSGNAGVLLGNNSAIDIETQLRAIASGSVQGANGSLTWLGALGITASAQGDLSIDSTKLSAALSGQTPGVSLADVQKLFSLSGQSDNPGIQFISGSTRTKASATPYQVQLTQAATQGSFTATNALAGTTLIDATHNALTLTVNGFTSSTITLAPGSYSQQSLAQALQAQINGNAQLLHQQVAVSVNNNHLVITSSAYGSASKVAVGGGTAAAALGFTGTESGSGQDVAGTFLVNGQTETAVGTGQFLVGSPGNANTADLQVRVTLSPAQIQPGTTSGLTVSRGIASQLDVLLNQYSDPVSGRFHTLDQSFQSSLDDIQNSITQQNQFLDAQRQQLVQEFVNLESTVSQLKSTGDFLAAQLNAINAFHGGTATSSVGSGLGSGSSSTGSTGH